MQVCSYQQLLTMYQCAVQKGGEGNFSCPGIKTLIKVFGVLLQGLLSTFFSSQLVVCGIRWESTKKLVGPTGQGAENKSRSLTVHRMHIVLLNTSCTCAQEWIASVLSILPFHSIFYNI